MATKRALQFQHLGRRRRGLFSTERRTTRCLVGPLIGQLSPADPWSEKRTGWLRCYRLQVRAFLSECLGLTNFTQAIIHELIEHQHLRDSFRRDDDRDPALIGTFTPVISAMDS
jgi:hypothetical protein